MSDGISIDTSELHKLAADLGEAGRGIEKDVRAVVQKGSLNIKNDLIAQAKSSASFKGMAGSITYETEERRNGITAEIGPDKDRRGGALGNIFFFGTSRGGGTGDLDGPLRAEEPRFLKALGDLAEDRLP